jgi:Na+-transporting NADH:ubiquinone oxidoreductase subunit NqrB
MRTTDPRFYQIGTLSLLLLWGFTGLDLSIHPELAIAMVATALGTQALFSRLFGLPRFDPLSPLISSLSLCLLLRTNAVGWAIAAAAVAIASKFLLRLDDRHLFNPTNFAIVVLIAATDRVWVSPGQWGTEAYLAFGLASLGGLVIHRAARSDVTYAFIGFYALLVCGRAVWLGDPLSIPLHHLENGAFLVFAFFMISDPKTTPDSRRGRILFALIVALGAAFVHFVLFRTNGFLWSLVVCCPLTPLLNRLFPGERYQWRPAGKIPAVSERSFA